MTNYDFYKEALKQRSLDKEYLKSTMIYDHLLKHYPHAPVYFAKITSMCLSSHPSSIRIRNDKWIADVKDRTLSFLLVGYTDKSNNIVLCFCSCAIAEYKFSTESSNSIIRQDYDDLEHLLYWDEDTINYWSYKKTKYSFYVTQNDNFDSHLFDHQFMFKSFGIFSSYNDENINSEVKEIHIPALPAELKRKVRDKFNNMCMLSTVTDNGVIQCPCGNHIDVQYLKENGLTYTHLHHFVPKKLFINQYQESRLHHLDWYEVHSEINLVPLCLACHESIHKGGGQKALVTKTFNNVIENFKQTNQYESFLNYLVQKCHLKGEEELLAFYLS